MKKCRVIISLLLAIVMMAGCANTSGLLEDFNDNYQEDYSEYMEEHPSDIPKSVLDTLDFMLENYTGGVAVPDIEDIETEELDDEDDKDDLIDQAPDEASDEDEIKDAIIAALTNTEASVTVRIPANIYSDEFIYNLIYEEITPKYIIEALGLNWYSYRYTKDVLTGDYVVSINFLYFKLPDYDHNFTLEQIKQMKNDLVTKAEYVVNQLNLKNLSNYDRAVAINKYLCDTITYTENKIPGTSSYMPIQHTPYGALMNGDCVCEGYAKAAQLLFTMCGQECYYVTGDAGGSHGWNIVEVDGKYYQLDVTWNDVDFSPNQYFLVTDDYMSLSRTWDKSKYPKVADRPYGA